MTTFNGVIVTDGAGDRYEVVGHSATFMLRSLDRPLAPLFAVDSSTLADLGVEWDGRALRPTPEQRRKQAS